MYRAVYSPTVGWWSVEENGRPVGWFPTETYARAFAHAMNWWRVVLSNPMLVLLPAPRAKQPELN